MLQSPAFLYHWELGYENPTVEGKVIRLNHYENASRLSYFLWGTMPDGDLFTAAAGNKLGTQAEIEAQARRMLGDPKARETITAFAGSWLNLDQVASRPKDQMVYPEWQDDLKNAMDAEVKVVPHQRGVRGRRPLRQPADGDQLLRQRPAGVAVRRCGRHGHGDEADDAGRRPARGHPDPRRLPDRHRRRRRLAPGQARPPRLRALPVRRAAAAAGRRSAGHAGLGRAAPPASATRSTTRTPAPAPATC